MDLFTLVARLGMDSREYEKGIEKARGSFSNLSSFVSAKAVAMGTMAARGIEKAADAAINLGKSAIQAAADMRAEQALFRQTFGTMQGEAEKAFDAVSKSTGVLDTRLKTVGTKAFMQFKGAGLGATDALAMMEEYTSLAADAAAAYNITLEEADAKLRSFIRGNTEAGDAIDLYTSQSQRNTAAMEKYGQKWEALTEAQKQMLMLDVTREIYKQNDVLGQAGRESEEFQTKLTNLQKAWNTAKGILGAPILATITPYLQDVTDFLSDEDVQLKLTQFGLSVSNAIIATVDFVLGIPSPTEMSAQLNRWWDEVKAGLNPFSVTSQVKIQKVEEAMNTGGTAAGVKVSIDEAWWNPKNWFDGTVIKTSPEGNVYESTHDGKGASFATGLDYVPYNNFYARLHEGEAVLTKTEANAWRFGGADTYIVSDQLLEEIRGLRDDMRSRREVFAPDGRVLGDLVTETVSRNIASRSQFMRYR